MNWDAIIAVDYSEMEDTIVENGEEIGSDLENLIEEWRHLDADSAVSKAIEKKKKRHKFECADELEALLE